MIRIVKISAVRTESDDTKTFEFPFERDAVSGQFVMVWIPGVDEIPMSLSSAVGTKSITVKAVGEATKALHKLKEGDAIGIRGPYGNGFSVQKGEKILAVAGGVGIAALLPLIRETGADTIIGAKSLPEVVLEAEVRKYSKSVRISTDDGSSGFKGTAVELMKDQMKKKKYDLVVSCGREIMMYHVHKTCVELGVECQLSLERFMKCGAGLCGACVMDGMRVCKDGPVFDSEQVSKLKELGRIRLEPAGNKAKL